MSDQNRFDAELAFNLHKQKMQETENMLRTLAIRINAYTECYSVPSGSTVWRIPRVIPNVQEIPENIEFNLIRFFGMGLGYDQDSNIIVYWTLDNKVINLQNQLARRDTSNLLKDLGERFNPDTKFYSVPKNSWKFPVATPDPKEQPLSNQNLDSMVKVKKIIVDLYPFFGMQVGYSKELNVLLYWA